MTKEDLDAEFSDVSPLNRRALYERIQGIKNPHGVSRRLKEARKLKEVDFKGYTGTISCAHISYFRHVLYSPPRSELESCISNSQE